MPIDDRTSNFDWPLPNASNNLSDDVLRIVDALVAIDDVVVALATIASVDALAATLAPKNSPALTGVPTAPTAGSGTNTTQLATTAFVQTAITSLIASAPGALDTLNELAAALGNDANFAATITAALATKAPKGNIGSSGLDISSTAKLLGRQSSGAGAVEELSLSQVLDLIGSAAHGDILYRGAAGWARLAAGTAGQFLRTQGAGYNPLWGNLDGWTEIASVSPSGTGTVTLFSIPQTYNNLLLLLNNLSHDSGSNQALNVNVSPDGSTFGSTYAMLSGVPGAGAWNGGIFFPGYRKDMGPAVGGITNTTNPYLGAGNANTLNNWHSTDGIHAIRVAWASGNFDGSSNIKLMGI